MRSARSKTISLLSLGAAVGLLGWSAQRGPRDTPTPADGYAVAQTVTAVTSCVTFTWGGGKAASVTESPCTSPADRAELRKLP